MTIASIASAQQAGFLESIPPHLFSFVVILVVVFALIGINRLFLRAEGAEGVTRVRKQSVMLALTLIGVIIIVLTLPVEETTEGQLLTLIGLAITAALTLASTTFIGNMMAGLMLRSVDNIRLGDFIKIEKHFGRVTERGLFHIEIQTEDRDLCTLPNLYVATTPTKVVSASGTIVSATVSLGYDTHHAKVEELLLQATEAAGLTDGFVQIVELGDFSITYRTAGFLPQVKHLLSARSDLRRAMLDVLHGGGVEVVSPTLMFQRPMSPEERVIPDEEHQPHPKASNGAKPEELMFDKAEEAEKIETLREKRTAAEESIVSLKAEIKGEKDPDEKDRLTARLEKHERMLEAINERIANWEA